MTQAVFPGTFDPMTLGHMDVLVRAARVFSHVTLAVAESRDKKTLLTFPERIDLARELTSNLSNVSVEGFTGLLSDYVREKNINVIVRGVRPAGDFAYEYEMAEVNSALSPNVETVFFAASPRFHFIKGSLVREIALMGGSVSAFVAPAASKALAKALTKT